MAEKDVVLRVRMKGDAGEIEYSMDMWVLKYYTKPESSDTFVKQAIDLYKGMK